MTKEQLLKISAYIKYALSLAFFTCGSAALASDNPLMKEIYFPNTQSVKVDLSLGPHQNNNWFDIDFYNGYIRGKSEEIVYVLDDSNKIRRLSQIDWDTGHLWVLGGKAAAHLSSDRFHVTIDGWMKAASSASTMIDRDWRKNDEPHLITDISWSSSYLKRAYGFVTELASDSPTYKIGQLSLNYSFLAGYEKTRFSWGSRGGVYVYNQGKSMGFFSDEPGISYDQLFAIPYLGFQIKTIFKQMFHLSTYVKYSYKTYVWDKDIHHLRDIIYDGQFQECKYWMVGSSLCWNLWKMIDCHLKYDFEQLNGTLGNMTIHAPDQPPLTIGGAGAFHYHQTFSLGLAAEF